MKTEVRREDDRVWIEGAAGWSFREKQSSVHAAQEAIMRAIGEDITYDYLLGVSSLAFRMQVSREGFCPSSPHSCCGYRCVARTAQALPWNARVFEFKRDDEDKAREARRAVVESIDRGIPAQYGSEEDGIIVGYRKDGEELICFHPLRDRGRTPFVETQWPWGVAVFTSPKETRAARRDLAVEALEQALTMANTPESGGYFLGFRAWEEYFGRLKALEKANEAVRTAAALGNAWIYECLTQYRASAARYLREIAGEFEEPAAEHLLKAARLYERMSSQVLRDEKKVTAEIAPYPGESPWGPEWTSEMRRDQIGRLERALPMEREAIGEIEKALALISQSVA